jgi:cytochrome b6-f complex iron-sulfur subunit
MSSRREFCQALSAIPVAAVVEACGNGAGPSGINAPSLPTIDANVDGGTIALTVDASSPLSPLGSAALVQTSAGNFLVAHTAAETFTALTAVCTHQVCTVTGYQSSTYVGPCHGSEFSTSGAVIRGPASAPLQSFATRFASPTLTITLA